jgi:hypothetical protein
MIHLVQITDGLSRRVAIVEEPRLRCLTGVQSVYELAGQCLGLGRRLSEQAIAHANGELLDYDAIYSGASEWYLLAPIDLPGASSRLMIAGTGLTHLGSAKERQSMHLADPPHLSGVRTMNRVVILCNLLLSLYRASVQDARGRCI